MPMLRKSYGFSYALFWLWMVIVTYTTFFIYSELIKTSTSVLSMLPYVLASDVGDSESSPPLHVHNALVLVIFALIWWRVVKVVVLQGAPFSFWMAVAGGRQDDGRRGRQPPTCT